MAVALRNGAVGVGLVLALTAAPGVARAQGFGTSQPLDLDANWTNHLRVTDLEPDGDLDVIIANCGGFFSTPPGPQRLRVYRNDLGVLTEVSDSAVGALTKPVRQVAVGDVDADGDPDLYVPDAGGAPAVLFINDGTGNFTDEAATRLPNGGSPRAGAARFGDVDDDGDLDLLVADGYAQGGAAAAVARLYLNDGAGVFSDSSVQLPTSALGVDPDDIDFIDIDRDFDLDVLINMHSGKSSLWVNDGAGIFSDATNQLAAMPGGFHYGPAVCDVDGDGDLDIWTDNMGPGYTEQLMLNDGSGTFSDVTSARVTGNPGADDNGVVCADVDQDGDFDAVIPSLQSAAERVLINDGAGNFVLADGWFPNESDPTLWMELGDIDGDGRLDAVTGQGEGNPETNLLYLGAASAAVDEQPPRIIAVQVPEGVAAGDTPSVRFAVSDATVTDEGPRLSRAWLQLSGANAQSIVANFVGGDLFRAVLPGDIEGTVVEFSACAEDRHGNAACSEPASYVVGEAGMGGGGGGVGGGAGAGTGAGGNAGQGGLGGSGATGDDAEDDDGCGCRMPGAGPGGSDLWYGLFMLVAGWAAATRRKRR